MSVELPFAPVDTIIREHAGDLRVSADAAAELARRIQSRGAELASAAAERATEDGRKTLRVEDFGVDPADLPERAELALPIAPVDRIARLDIPDEYRVSEDARVALADRLEDFAADAAEGARVLAEHAGRRTVQAEDVDTYFRVCE
ncbi:histone family protein [Halospeciosus flavus]|uniref:Histone family protein n=1 Tax=Halospeciosus flavus TaxID=3032283 RepID=A0ABD5Z5K8_9EURY|nr:histone [Halospeciosus flavus]